MWGSPDLLLFNFLSRDILRRILKLPQFLLNCTLRIFFFILKCCSTFSVLSFQKFILLQDLKLKLTNFRRNLEVILRRFKKISDLLMQDQNKRISFYYDRKIFNYNSKVVRLNSFIKNKKSSAY